MICSKNHNNKPIEEFILVSPAPVDTAAKLSSIYINLSNKVYLYNTDFILIIHVFIIESIYHKINLYY